ncbi:hypothetical protein IW261DRAFT_1594399 [Armillaria novae-zelandiae]|uniref:Uncharacterized protein n=1 Tax=Armillaria novae-zelandiae TaxID=153914 RepID=A0AA39P5K5_9AGAR|nr:hypothetical protein IW261DRAFT_1594399 [Armillaria novae-zelandiae]
MISCFIGSAKTLCHGELGRVCARDTDNDFGSVFHSYGIQETRCLVQKFSSSKDARNLHFVVPPFLIQAGAQFGWYLRLMLPVDNPQGTKIWLSSFFSGSDSLCADRLQESKPIASDLAWLRVLLSNLPTDLHAPKKGEFTCYPFATFCINQAILECTEDEVGVINESCKAIFGWRTCTTGNGIIDIEEHGKHGIGTVADLVEGYFKKYRDKKGSPNAVLIKWVEDISAGCVKIYHTHNKPIYLLEVGNTLDVLELDPDINLNAPCLRNVLPTSASEASAAVVFVALVESPTAPRPASNVDGAEKDVNGIDWDML